MFCKTLSLKTLLCFAIHLTIVITSLSTVVQIIVSTKDDLHPHWPPPLPLSVSCWHRRHCCHGCHIVAAIAAIAIAAATATAATISAVISTISAAIATAFWLIIVCLCAASASATIAWPCTCRCWLPMPLPLSSRPQTAAPCSFHCNRVMFKILHFK